MGDGRRRMGGMGEGRGEEEEEGQDKAIRHNTV